MLLIIQKVGGADAAQDIMVKVGFIVLIPMFLILALVIWLFNR